jgi:multisubunit Na+/H+ antiporter MnhB subunit
MSESITNASTYTKIGAVYVMILGIIIMLVGGITPAQNGQLMIVAGIIVLFLGIASYSTTTLKLDRGDARGARGPCLVWGLLFIFVGVVGGILFLLAHSTISQYLTQITIGPPPRPLPGGEEREIPTEVRGHVLASLECVTGPDAGKSFPLYEGTTRIGRARENHVRLSDGTVSRRHAEIEWDGVDFRIRDIGSRNGTMVNDNPLARDQPCILRDGDHITLGANTVLRFSRIGAGRAEMEETLPPGPPGVERETQPS